MIQIVLIVLDKTKVLRQKNKALDLKDHVEHPLNSQIPLWSR